jgi:putative nucleotidyltransferase with HDIG domain
MKDLPLKLRIYFITLYIITVVTLVVFIKIKFISLKTNANYIDIIFFSVITILTESFPAYLGKMVISTTFAITIATFSLFGPLVCIITLVIGYTFRILKVELKVYKHFFNTPLYGTVFNYCVLIFPLCVANCIYIFISRSKVNNSIENLLPISIFVIIYFLINTFLISIIQGISIGKNIFYCFFSDVRIMLLNILAMLPLGIVLDIFFVKYRYVGAIIILFPIALVRYTFSLYVESKSQYVQTVDALMRAIEARDKYTEGHSQRVAEISTEIAKYLKYSEKKIEKLNMAAMLHDVGKIGIPDAILNKTDKLTKNEFDEIKQHPVIGFNILKDIRNLQGFLDIIFHHHERYDGKGYPDGKIGEELNMDVYIIQLADSIDAMATDRPYRKALALDIIVKEIRENSGTQFHPKVAEAYLNILKNKNLV